MAFTLVTDELWEAIEPLLPKHKPDPRGGRPRKDDRACLTGIVYVLRTGMPWNLIPQELGCGCGSTCWRRLDEWTKAGVWSKVHKKLLSELVKQGRIDPALAILDSASFRAVFGGRTPARTPNQGSVTPRIAGKKAARGTS
jgi:transposase